MALDNKAKRKALLAELKALPPENRAEDVINLLDARRRGEKRRPSRICGDLLPYRYATARKVDLGCRVVSISVFANLAHYLSKHDVLTLAQDSSLFEQVKDSLKDERLPSTWSECLREWSNTSPDLGLQFYCEVCNVQVNPRKRKNEALGPEPKRQCHIQSEDGLQSEDGRDGVFEPRSSSVAGEEASRTPGADEQNPELRASEAIPSTAATMSHSLETVPQHAQSTRPGDHTAPENIRQPQTTGTGVRENLDNHPARLPETQKKVMAMTLSRCRVAVYPVEVFSDLIKQTSQDIRFRRRESGVCNYRSDVIKSGAGQFCILVSQEILDQVVQSCDGETLVHFALF